MVLYKDFGVGATAESRSRFIASTSFLSSLEWEIFHVSELRKFNLRVFGELGELCIHSDSVLVYSSIESATREDYVAKIHV